MKCSKCGHDDSLPPKEVWVFTDYGRPTRVYGVKQEGDFLQHRYVLAPEKPAKPRKKARKP